MISRRDRYTNPRLSPAKTVRKAAVRKEETTHDKVRKSESELAALRYRLLAFSIGQQPSLQLVGRRRMDRKRRGHRARWRLPVRLLHKAMEPVLLGIDFDKPLPNIGAPLLRSPHFQHESPFFHFKHG